MRGIALFTLLAGALVLAVALVGGSAVASEPAISPTELAALLESVDPPVVLDVRSPEEYAQGHVPGARLVPYDTIEAHLDELRGLGEVIVYCRSGRRSAIAEEALEAAGLRVRQLEGSFLAWQAAELPIARPQEPTE